jgi:hypothetical protein
MTEHVCSGDADRGRVRRVRREVRRENDRRQRGIELIRSRRPIVELRVLRGDVGIVMGDVHQGIRASSARRVPVEAGLGKPASDLITEPVEQTRPSVLG